MRGTERPSRQRAGSVVPGLADQPELAIRQLREAGVRGVLTYSDEECKLHAVSLPDLRPVRAPSYEMCRPAMASGGLGTVDGDVVWAGLGYGTFQVVLSKEELGRELTRLLSSPGRHPDLGFRAVQAVALDDERTVVLADSTYVPKDRVPRLAAPRARRPRPAHVADPGRALPQAQPHRRLLRVDGSGRAGLVRPGRGSARAARFGATSARHRLVGRTSAGRPLRPRRACTSSRASVPTS